MDINEQIARAEKRRQVLAELVATATDFMEKAAAGQALSRMNAGLDALKAQAARFSGPLDVV
ncbi:hypothetical protein AB0D10_05280 [Kitasatospora sp. NPDC048545]|uniref:hypothetical protein n=1 Tax=Kitasatospora sp. NPDC048545 TaxID=3157208 RepID=UPI0033C05CB0